MLTTLPHETISLIAGYLNFRSRLNLALTCRQVHGLLCATSLYGNIEIQAIHHEAVTTMSYDRTSSVRVLTVNARSVQRASEFDFISSFDKIQEIYIDGANPEMPLSSEFVERFDYLKETIRVYDQARGFAPIFQLLKSGSTEFKNLTALSVMALISDSTDPTDISITLRNCIRSTPDLTLLKIDDCTTTMTLLEEIHNSCPKIKSLELTNSKLDLRNFQFPLNIVPADAMESFVFGCRLSNDTECMFFRYLVIKYPNLRAIDFNQWMDQSVRHPPHGRQTRPVFTDRNTHQVYATELPALLRQLTPQLRVFKFESHLIHNFMSSMQQDFRNIVEATFYKTGDNSGIFSGKKKNHYFLNQMPLLRTLTVHIKESANLYATTRTRRHNNIETLKIIRSSQNTDDPAIQLDQLLATFITLKHLSIHASHLGISISAQNNPNHSHRVYNPENYTTLKKLDLYGRINAEVLGYVERSLPNVVELSWRNTLRPVRINNFLLPNRVFHLLDINLPPQMHYLRAYTGLTVHYNIHKEDANHGINVFAGMELIQLQDGYKVRERTIDPEAMQIDVDQQVDADQPMEERLRNPIIVNITCADILQLQCGNITII